MPRFTLIKQADNLYDAEVKMEFEAEVLDLARAHYEDFLQAAGFELPSPVETTEDQLEKAEDMMWDDAFASKFSYDEVYSSPAPALRDDGILGVTGEDNIVFGNFSKGPSIDNFNDSITFF